MRDHELIYQALAELRTARGLVYEEVRGTNDYRYDWWKRTEHVVKDAEAALRRLQQETR